MIESEHQASHSKCAYNLDQSLRLKVASRGCKIICSQKPLSKHICFDIDQQNLQKVFPINDPDYSTTANLLLHTRITAQDRERLKSWMLSQTQNQYCRSTYATASRFLDLFFIKRQRVAKTEFQLLGLACLLMATKIVESRIPSISYQVFDKDRILHFQALITQSLNFKLNPVTYIQIAQFLFLLWDSYLTEFNKFRRIKYFKDSRLSIIRARSIFQTLDCMDLVNKSLDFKLIDLVACTFYVQHRKFCVKQYRQLQKNNENKAFYYQDSQFKQFDCEYEKVISNFMKDVAKNVGLFKDLRISPKTLMYVMQYSRLSPRFQINQYKKFRQQLLRQTYNEEISRIAQVILARRV